MTSDQFLILFLVMYRVLLFARNALNFNNVVRGGKAMADIRLFDYQADAIGRMKNGCILCGGVGSGKSLTAIGYYYLQNGGDPISMQGASIFQ